MTPEQHQQLQGHVSEIAKLQSGAPGFASTLETYSPQNVHQSQNKTPTSSAPPVGVRSIQGTSI
jgi:hypothetical protein